MRGLKGEHVFPLELSIYLSGAAQLLYLRAVQLSVLAQLFCNGKTPSAKPCVLEFFAAVITRYQQLRADGEIGRASCRERV